MRILIADDEVAFCKTARRLLVREGHDVTICHSCKRTLTLIKHHGPWDAIVLDYQFPDGTADRVLQNVPDHLLRRIGVVSGYTDSEMQLFLQRSDIRVLHKPLDRPTLLTLADDLEQRGREQAAAEAESQTRARAEARRLAALYRLSPTETRVLELTAQGLSNRAIAGQLGNSQGTVGEHLKRIYDKVGVANKEALVALLQGRSSGEAE